MKSVTARIGDREFRVTVAHDGSIVCEDSDIPVSVGCLEPGVYTVTSGDRTFRIVARNNPDGFIVLLEGTQHVVTVETERARLLKQYSRTEAATQQRVEIHAPMPALVGRILVEEGGEVRSGQALLVLEAMKMENEIKSHRNGTVRRLAVVRGQTVEKGQLLLIVE